MRSLPYTYDHAQVRNFWFHSSLKFFYLSIILSMEQPLITISLCYDCTNLHEPYDPPILVFLQIPLSKKSWGERAFAHAGPALWNSLPQQLKDSNSSTSFKCNLKTHLFNLAFWRQIFFLYGVHVYDSLVMFVICFVYVVKRLEHFIKMDMALYKSYVLLLCIKQAHLSLCIVIPLT